MVAVGVGVSFFFLEYAGGANITTAAITPATTSAALRSHVLTVIFLLSGPNSNLMPRIQKTICFF
jgi:hypothetical protein